MSDGSEAFLNLRLSPKIFLVAFLSLLVLSSAGAAKSFERSFSKVMNADVGLVNS